MTLAMVLGIIFGVLACVGVAAIGTGLYLWSKRLHLIKTAVKRAIGVDVDLASVDFKLSWKPIQLTADIQYLKLYLPPDKKEEDVVMMVPKVHAVITKTSREVEKAKGHKWMMEADFTDMQVQYVYLKLSETNIDRLVGMVVKDNAEQIPVDQRTGKAKQVIKQQQKEDKGKSEESAKRVAETVEAPEDFVVKRLSLKGRTVIAVKANHIHLVPPIVLAETDIQPEILKHPAGLLLWINMLVLRTMERGGIDLALLVAKTSVSAGLAVAGTALQTVRMAVTGGQHAADYTFKGVTYAADGTVQAGKAVVMKSWEGVSTVSKFLGDGAVTVAGGITGGTVQAGKVVGTGVSTAGKATWDTTGKFIYGVSDGTLQAGKFVGNGAASVGKGAVDVTTQVAQGVGEGTIMVGKAVGGGAMKVTSETGKAFQKGAAETAKAFQGMGSAFAGAFSGGKSQPSKQQASAEGAETSGAAPPSPAQV